ncbi:MAG: pyrroline-5-carboxylate reductase [Candidatus Ancillula sp.]|jgi:pyrroline-5-carboxylate reductase|nr:pyrroline-5-carboxylate reductase [Candidatus Ancillula sp.]
MNELKLTVIGYGNMGSALARAAQSTGAIVNVISHTDFDLGKLESVKDCDVLLLAVKPKGMFEVLNKVREELNSIVPESRPILFTVAAGLEHKFYSDVLKKDNNQRWKVIRGMPNTPVSVGSGVISLTGNANVDQKDIDLVKKMFEKAGTLVEIPEKQINALTAISGSGPAYFYAFTESLIKAGENLGLSSELSRLLAKQTLIGSAKLINTPDSEQKMPEPENLRIAVTSPGGTTAAALDVYNKTLDNLSYEACKANIARSVEMANV